MQLYFILHKFLSFSLSLGDEGLKADYDCDTTWSF